MYRGATDQELVLENGLIRRCFRLQPNAATVAFDNLMTGESVIRAVNPEALISVDGAAFDVGGLTGQPEHAYLLPQWVDQMTATSNSFRCTGFEVGATEAPFAWKRQRHSADLPWPPPGVSVHFRYEPPAERFTGVVLTVHYELYDGLPVMAKWISLQNGSGKPVTVDSFSSEVLAAAEVESAVDQRPFRSWRLPALTLLSDYSFNGMDATTASQTTAWLADPQYLSQVNYERKMPALLVSRPPVGPEAQVGAGQSFQSFRTYIVVHDSDSRRAPGINALPRPARPGAVVDGEPDHDARAQRGIEALQQRGGPMRRRRIRDDHLYVRERAGHGECQTPSTWRGSKRTWTTRHAKGIEVGAYSLLASRRISDEHDVINPTTGKPGGAIFGNSPCLCSRWGEEYFAQDQPVHRGDRAGFARARRLVPGRRLRLHAAIPAIAVWSDSQWMQWQTIADFISCAARGACTSTCRITISSPGQARPAMGYRESNWSLPRERQIILGRQNIYDGTWTKSPTMGWMFVPLVEYQGGGRGSDARAVAANTWMPMKRT